MYDTYVYKVFSVNQSSAVVHSCGTRAYFCEVENPFVEELYYCPACGQFFETLDDYWYDDKIVWEAEKPTMIYHEGNELLKSIIGLRSESIKDKNEIAKLNQQITKYMEILAQLVEREIVAKEAIDPIENEILGPEE